MLFAGHRMSANEPPRCILTKDRPRTIDNFLLGAAYIGDQGIRRCQRANTLNQIDNRSHRRSQHNQAAPLDGFNRIFRAQIHCAHGPRAIQDCLTVAAHDLAAKASSLEREAQRASDQSCADDGDLFECHVEPKIVPNAEGNAKSGAILSREIEEICGPCREPDQCESVRFQRKSAVDVSAKERQCAIPPPPPCLVGFFMIRINGRHSRNMTARRKNTSLKAIMPACCCTVPYTAPYACFVAVALSIPLPMNAFRACSSMAWAVLL